ncbi:MAG: GntR family transcriptional regulator [Planctomycetota bacterium]|jgi:DNA-binding LacI/PurR family transcriptional regulator/DNA-binding transcriptional regulator YhcF (GntR family)
MKKALFLEISEKIEEMLRNMPISELNDISIPPLRELARQHDISLVTAKKAIDELVSKGLLTSRRRVGISINIEAFENEKLKNERLKIGVLYCHFPDDIKGNLEIKLRGINNFFSTVNTDSRIIYISPENPESDIEEFFNNTIHKLDGVILSTRMPLELVTGIIKSKTPFTWINDFLRHARTPAVVLNKLEAFSIIRKYAKDMNAANTAFLMSSMSDEDQIMIEHTFKEGKSKLLKIFSEGKLMPAGERHNWARQKTEDMIKSKNLPELIVCEDPAVTNGVINTLLNTDIIPGKDIKLLPMIHQQEDIYNLSFNLDAIYVPLEDISLAAGKLLYQIIEGNEPENCIHYIDPQLIKGKK